MKFSSSDVAFGEESVLGCNFILLAILSLDFDFDVVVKSSSKGVPEVPRHEIF